MASNKAGATATRAESPRYREMGGPRLLRKYKPEQGKWTRLGTAVGAGALIAWGAYYIAEQLSVFAGPGVVSLLITKGIPLVFAVVLAVLIWWVTYSGRKSSDFMIATEGEMKKVNWTSKREIFGSTKVVIFFTVLLAILLFMCDLMFQHIFSWIGVLKA